MRLMGSKTGRYDPEPPDVNLHALNRMDCAQARLIAWVKSKTVAYGHVSPYCVDEKGNVLTKEHAAGDLGWKVKTVQNELTELVRAGVVRLDAKNGQARIWLCADIPGARKRVDEDGRKSSVQGIFPTYLYDSIKNLPAEKRARIEAKYQEYLDWRPIFFAEGMAKLRAIDEHVEDTVLRSEGLEKKRGPKNALEEAGQLKLELTELPSFVQGMDESPAQGNGATSYKVKKETVQKTPIITDFPDKTEGLDAAAAVRLKAEAGELAAALTIDAAAAENLLHDCRAKERTVTVPEIVELAAIKLGPPEKRAKIASPTGLLLTFLPAMCGVALPALRATMAAREKQQGAQREREKNDRLEALRYARETLEHPASTAEEKEFARELLGEKTKGAGT
jgi:hypothetical protein